MGTAATVDQLGLLREAIARNATMVLSLPAAGRLRHHKTRFLADAGDGFWVAAVSDEPGLLEELIGSQQPAGVSFRSGEFKVIFATPIQHFQPDFEIAARRERRRGGGRGAAAPLPRGGPRRPAAQELSRPNHPRLDGLAGKDLDDVRAGIPARQAGGGAGTSVRAARHQRRRDRPDDPHHQQQDAAARDRRPDARRSSRSGRSSRCWKGGCATRRVRRRTARSAPASSSAPSTTAGTTGSPRRSSTRS